VAVQVIIPTWGHQGLPKQHASPFDIGLFPADVRRISKFHNVTAASKFYLAPLNVRRDIAMLDIRRTPLGNGQRVFNEHF